MGWSSRGDVLLLVSFVEIVLLDPSTYHIATASEFGGNDVFVQAFRSFYLEQNPRTVRDDHSQPVVNNLLIQIFLNAKNVSHLNSTKQVTNIRKQVTFESGRETGRSPLGSTDNPIIIVKDFDRETLTFIDDYDKKLPHNPESLVEVKVVVSALENDTSNMMQSGQIDEEVDRKLHSSIPVILQRLDEIKKHNDEPVAESQTFDEAFSATNLAKKITRSEDNIANKQIESEEGETKAVTGSEGSLGLLSTLPEETADGRQHEETTTTPSGERDEEILASELDEAIEEAVMEISRESQTTMQAETENEEKAIGDEIERTIFKEIGNGQSKQNQFTTTFHDMDMLSEQWTTSQTSAVLEFDRTTLEEATEASGSTFPNVEQMQTLSFETPSSTESSTKSSKVSLSIATPEFSTVEMTIEEMRGSTDEGFFQKTTEGTGNTAAESSERFSTAPPTVRPSSFVSTTEIASEETLITEMATVERPSESFSPFEGQFETIPTVATTLATVEIEEFEGVTATSTEKTPGLSETPEILSTASASTPVSSTVEEETSSSFSATEFTSITETSSTAEAGKTDEDIKSSSAFITEEPQHETASEFGQEPFATGAFLPTEKTTSYELLAESTTTTGETMNTVTQSTSESAETFSTFSLSEGITGSSQITERPLSSTSITEGGSFLTEGATTSESQIEVSAEMPTTAGLLDTANAAVPQRPETLFPAKAVQEEESEETEGSTERTERTEQASAATATEAPSTIVSSATSEMATAEREEDWTTKPLLTTGADEPNSESTEVATASTFTPATTLSEEEEEHNQGLLSGMEKTSEEAVLSTTEKTVTAELIEGTVSSTMQTEQSVESFTQPSTEAIDETTVVQQIPQRICAMPNDKSDTTKLDVLFLLDTSSSIGEAQFQRALKLVVDTVKEFRNVGPDGIQVSLVQFNHEPYLEFSFRKHNCKPQLLEDIADTTYMKGVSNLGNAINKVAKFGFNKRRGDRPDADNVLVILTDGMSDDKIQQPLQLVRNNGTAVLVIAAIEARPELVRELVGHRESNIFNLSDALDRPLAERLSQRIRESQLDAMPPFSSLIMADVTESVTVPSTVSSAVSTETFTTEELPYTVTNEAFATEEHPDATETVGTISEVLTSTTEMRTVSEIMREESVTTTASSEPSTQTVPAEEEDRFLASGGVSSVSVDEATTISATETSVEPEITGGREFSSVQEGKGSTEEAVAFTSEIATTMPSEEGEGTHEAEEITSVKPEEAKPTAEETGFEIEQEGTTFTTEEFPTVRPTSTIEQAPMELSEHTSFIGDVSVQCLEDGFNLTLRLPQSFAGMIIVKGHSENEGCYKEVSAIESANSEALRDVSFFVDGHKCAISKVRSVDPPGMNTSAVVNVLHHKWLITGVDKGYLIQCFMANVENGHDISTELNVNGTILTGETLSLASVPPTCIYSLRRDSPNGPIVKYALLGQTIYHRWECDGDDAAEEVYGMYVHDCFAGSDTNHEFPIIDSKGCSPNKNILSDLTYADDRLMASARSSAFSLADIEHLLFHCKISLCTRQGDGCEGITPPKCSSSNDTDLLQREVRHYPEAISAALTSVVEADVDVPSLSSSLIEPTTSLNSILLSTIQSSTFWIFIVLFVVAILATLILIRYIRKVNAKNAAIADAEGILYKRRTSDISPYSSNICYMETCDCAATSSPSSTSIPPYTVCEVPSVNGEKGVDIANEQRSIALPTQPVTVEFHPTCIGRNEQLSSASFGEDIRQQRITNSGTSEVVSVIFDPSSEHT